MIYSNKKLSYRRDSARRRSSRSSKVTDFISQSKARVRLIILTSYLAPFARYRAVLIKLNYRFSEGCLSNEFVLQNVCQYLYKSSVAKNYILWTIFPSILNYIYITGPKAAEFGRKTQNNGHYAVQAHRFW